MKVTRNTMRRICAGAYLALSCVVAHAAPVFNYAMVLMVKTVSGPCFIDSAFATYGCDVAPGDRWRGRFTIATDLSAVADGAYDVPFVSMFLRTGGVVWRHEPGGLCAPVGDSNCLEGYRTGSASFSDTGPGFHVSGGQIVGFAGGFYGLGDALSLDFDYFFASGAGAGRFAASTEESPYILGTYAINRVPEPKTHWLAMAGLLALLTCRWGARRRVSVLTRRTLCLCTWRGSLGASVAPR